jgi:hypothetical protein
VWQRGDKSKWRKKVSVAVTETLGLSLYLWGGDVGRHVVRESMCMCTGDAYLSIRPAVRTCERAG